MKGHLKFAIALIIISGTFFTGCTGPAGADGQSFYLEDGNGTRYYSGAEIFLGDIPYSAPTDVSLVTSLHFVNMSNETVTFNANPVFTFEYEMYGGRDTISYFSTTAANFQYLTNDFTAITTASDVLSGANSPDFTFTLSEYDNTGTLGGMVRRRYLVELSGETEDFNFVFEVYGITEDGGSNW